LRSSCSGMRCSAQGADDSPETAMGLGVRLNLAWARLVSNQRPLACEMCPEGCRVLRSAALRLEIARFVA
jgi:hypothetical protein